VKQGGKEALKMFREPYPMHNMAIVRLRAPHSESGVLGGVL
jgi:hypothetical protein